VAGFRYVSGSVKRVEQRLGCGLGEEQDMASSRRASRRLVRESIVRFGSALGAVALLAAAANAQQRVWSNEGGHVADSLGGSLTYVADVDGDGVPDFLAGAPGSLPGVVGKAKLFSGATRALIRTFNGDTAGDGFGSVVADLGDVDGDGIDDFAIGAPSRHVDANYGAIFVVSGATGATIRTITPTAPASQTGNILVAVGDVDGDGVRDLLYSDSIGSTHFVHLVSGKTGATIRDPAGNQTAFGFAVGRVGDVDADGVDDYAISDLDGVGHVHVYSGATGAQLWKIRGWASGITTAGDVDLDGHADFMLADGSPLIHVVSGATGTNLYDLDTKSFFGWLSMSPTGDVDGDGRPDLVATIFGDVHVFSGASGSEIGVLHPTGATYVVDVDATQDVDGDGIPDVLAGDPFVANLAGLQSGVVDVVSSATGATLGEARGDAFVSEYGSSVTLVNDRDGDGWRDIAVVVPGGLESGKPNLVQIVSGHDGHELSRFQTASVVHDHDREIVSVGDVNGDGVSDVAVAAPDAPFPSPPAHAIEIHSGADDSLLATLVTPSGSPEDLAAAADVNGTPLLAVATNGPDNVFVYDLTTNAVVTTWAGKGDRMVACVGDVNGDGVVDWCVLDPHQWGTVYVFSGGASATQIWKMVGTASNPIDTVASTGDLDGDGFDDVLLGDVSDNFGAGKVTALSGVNGAKIFEIKGTQSFENFGYKIAPLGDVNRDGVADFAVGAQYYDAGVSLSGAVFVYSGKTATQLYRFDATNGGDYTFSPLMRTRWHDDARVDPDKSPDLVVGTPGHDFSSGVVELDRLDDLMLQVDPPNPVAGSFVTATTRGGPPGNLVGLYAVDLSGTPLGYFIATGTLNSKGNFVVSDMIPSSMAGLTLDVISYAVGFNGKLVDSQQTAIDVQ
jgi:hypothetical protein